MIDRADLAFLAKAMGHMVREYVSVGLLKLEEQIKAIPAGPPGEKGEKGESGAKGESGLPGEKGEIGISGKDGRDGRDGKDGKDGRDGQDALDLTILDGIDETRIYRRGTFAYWKGGLVRFDGQQWKCIVRGIDQETDEMANDSRTRIIKTIYTDGSVRESISRIPVLIYREIFIEGQTYHKGDVVTLGGSMWHCQMHETKMRPGIGAPDWRLMVKEGQRGRDGKDGKDGKDGERGPEGPRGRDLTQMGFDGRKH